MDITPYLTAIMAIIGMVIGTLVSPKINQKINAEHNRRDLLFKKKLEYFEKLTETIEENKRMYHQIIGKLGNSSNKEIDKIICELKEKRKNLLVKSSPLYFDTRKFSEVIVHFVRIERNIFQKVEQVKDKKNDKENLIEQLKEDMKKLNIKEREIIIEMRRELGK